MKRVERFWVAFCLIGTLARLLVKPYDPLLQVIGGCGLALWCAFAFFFLAAGTSRTQWKALRVGWPEVVGGGLAGLLAGYAVFSMLLHWLGWTRPLDALVLAGGSLLALVLVLALLQRVRPAKTFYRLLLLRGLLLLAALLLVVLLKPVLFPGRVLNYLNPA